MRKVEISIKKLGVINKYNGLSVQLKATIWYLICSFLQKGISVLTTPIFTRLLNTAEYGQFNVFNSWSAVLTIIISMNLSAGVYQQGLIKFEDKRPIFSSSLQGLTTTLSLFWLIIYVIFHSFWNSITSLTTIQSVSMILMIWTTAVYSFWAAEQRVEYKYKQLVLLTIIVSILKPVLGIILVINSEDKVTARILGLVIVEFVFYIYLYYVQLRKGRVFYSKYFWKYSVLFNLPLIPHYLSQTLLNNVDRIMIKNMVGASAAGIYSLAYSVALVMTLFNTALTQTLNPWMYEKIKQKKEKDLASVAYLSLIVIAGVNLALIALAPEIVKVFAPNSYYDAIWVIPPIAMSVYFMYSYDLFAKFAFYYEKTKYIMIASIIGAVLNIVLNLVFIEKFGYYAAGYTTLVCYVIYSLAHYFLMIKICNKYCGGARPYSINILIIIPLIFLSLGFLLLFTYQLNVIRYSLALILLLLAVINRDRLKQLYLKTRL